MCSKYGLRFVAFLPLLSRFHALPDKTAGFLGVPFRECSSGPDGFSPSKNSHTEKTRRPPERERRVLLKNHRYGFKSKPEEILLAHPFRLYSTRVSNPAASKPGSRDFNHLLKRERIDPGTDFRIRRDLLHGFAVGFQLRAVLV